MTAHVDDLNSGLLSREARQPERSASIVWIYVLLHLRLVVAGAIVGCLMAGAMQLWSPQPWRASADIELQVSAGSEGSRADLGAVMTDSMVENQGVLALSRPVMTRAAQALQEALPNSAKHHAGDVDVRALQRDVTVRRLPRTMVWRITAAATTPDAAVDKANAVVAAWMTERKAAQAQTAAQLGANLDRIIPELEQRLQQSERVAAQWRRRHALAPQGDDGASLADRQMTRLNEQLALARAATIAAQARVQRLQANGTEPADAEPDPALAALQLALAALTRREAELAARYGPGHPDRVNIQAQIAATTRSLVAERTRRQRQFEAELEEARQREEGLRQMVAAAAEPSSAVQSQTDRAVRLRELERQAAADRTAYEAALGQRRQVQMLQHVAGPEPRLVLAAPDDAVRSATPGQVMLLGGLFGGLVMFAVGAFYTRLQNPCLTPQQLALDLGGQPVAQAPLLFRDERKARGHIAEPATLVALRPQSAFAQGLRGLLASLDATRSAAPPRRRPIEPAGHGLAPAPGRVTVVTSAQPGDGKTTTAIGLGLTMAAAGRRVLLIDADMYERGMSRWFDLPAQSGLAELLQDEVSFATASARRHNLTVVPAGIGSTGIGG